MIRFYHWPIISSQMKNEKAQNFCFSLGWLTSCISVAGLKMPESWWGTVSGAAVTVSLEEINACIWVLVSRMQAAVILISWGPAENERAEEGWICSAWGGSSGFCPWTQRSSASACWLPRLSGLQTWAWVGAPAFLDLSLQTAEALGFRCHACLSFVIHVRLSLNPSSLRRWRWWQRPTCQRKRLRWEFRSWVREILEKGVATPCSILARKIPQTEEPSGPQPMGSQRVGHGWVAERTHLFIHLSVSRQLSVSEQPWLTHPSERWFAVCGLKFDCPWLVCFSPSTSYSVIPVDVLIIHSRVWANRASSAVQSPRDSGGIPSSNWEQVKLEGWTGASQVKVSGRQWRRESLPDKGNVKEGWRQGGV